MWRQHGCDGRGDTDAHGAGFAGSHSPYGCLRAIDLVENGFGAGQELLTSRGERHPAGGASEERCAQFLLQTAYQRAERRCTEM